MPIDAVKLRLVGLSDLLEQVPPGRAGSRLGRRATACPRERQGTLPFAQPRPLGPEPAHGPDPGVSLHATDPCAGGLRSGTARASGRGRCRGASRPLSAQLAAARRRHASDGLRNRGARRLARPPSWPRFATPTIPGSTSKRSTRACNGAASSSFPAGSPWPTRSASAAWATSTRPISETPSRRSPRRSTIWASRRTAGVRTRRSRDLGLICAE